MMSMRATGSGMVRDSEWPALAMNASTLPRTLNALLQSIVRLGQGTLADIVVSRRSPCGIHRNFTSGTKRPELRFPIWDSSTSLHVGLVRKK